MNILDMLQAIGLYLNGEPLAGRLFFASAELAVIGLAVGFLIRFARIRSARITYLLWLIVLIKPLVSLTVGSVLPVIKLDVTIPDAAVLAENEVSSPNIMSVSDQQSVDVISEDTAVIYDDTVSQTAATADLASIAPPEFGANASFDNSKGVPIGRVIMLLWLAGVVFFMSRYVLGRVRLHAIIRKAWPAGPSVMSQYRAIASRLGLKRVPRVVVTRALESPALVGIIRPAVLMPSWLAAEATSSKLDWSMRHELTHFRYADPVAILLRDAAMVVFWFHPVIWWSSRRLTEAMELACDRYMVRDESDATDYADQLFNILQSIRQYRRVAVTGGIFATRTQIGKRMAALLDESFDSSPQLTRRSVTALAIMALATLAVGAAVRSDSAGEDQISQTGPRATRVVRFPADRSLGFLVVQDASVTRRIDEFSCWQTYHEGTTSLGQAIGDVTVPQGRLRLYVGTEAAADLSGLGQLGPDDLYELSFGKRSPEDHKATDASVRHIAHLTGLRALDLASTRITSRGLRLLKDLKSLEYLLLPTRVSDSGLAAVGKVTSLKGLFFNRMQVTNKGLAHLKNLTSLEELALGGDRLTDEGLVHLTGLPSLKFLALWGKNFTDAGLVNLKNVPSVRVLSLEQMPVTDDGLIHLANLPNLENLSLHRTTITDKGLAHLKAIRTLKKLKLDLASGNADKPPITDAGMVHLSQIKTLEYLRLPNTGITDKGLAHLSELGKLKYLWVSGSSNSPVTDEGLRHVAKLRDLEELLIAGKGITDEGMSYLATLPNLKKLSFTTTSITNEGFARLATIKSLKHLWLRGSQISVSGLKHLNGLGDLTNLKVSDILQDGSGLDLSGLTRLDDLSLTAAEGSAFEDEDLAGLANLKKLTRLYVGGRGPGAIGDAGLRHLAGLTNLEHLGIGAHNATDRGLVHLANLRSLRRLTITGNFTDEGLRHLEGLKLLDTLHIISSSNLSQSALARLRKSLPNLLVFNADRDREIGRAGASDSKQTLKIGDRAPPFALETLDGKKISLADYRGKVVFLYFWATWCSPCVASMPNLKDFEADMSSKFKDFTMISLSMDDHESKLKSFVNQQGLGWTQARIGNSSKLAADYVVTDAPDYFLIGPDGKIISTSGNLKRIYGAIRKALADK